MDPDQLQLERAKIAVEEYKVLHAEVLQRNAALMKVAAGAATAAIALIGLWASGHLRLITTSCLIFLVLLAFGIAWKYVDSDTRAASTRIAEIERYVNDAVGGDAANPLSWERRFGLPVRNYWDRFRRGDRTAGKES